MSERVLAGRSAWEPIEPVEPSVVERRFARTLRATFVALTDTGFTRDQAMEIVVATVAGTVSSDVIDDDDDDDE